MRSDAPERHAEAARELLARIWNGEGDTLEIRHLAGELFGQVTCALEELRAATGELNSRKEQLDKAQAAIQRDQGHYYNLFYYAPDAYLVTDYNTIITETNAEAQRMFRLPGGHVPGTSLIDFVPPAERKEFIGLVARAKSRKAPQTWEMALERADGTRLASALNVMVTRDPEGRPRGLLWMVQDRTEIEEAGQELDQRLRMEKLIASVAHRFIGSAAGEIASDLQWALGSIGEYAGADRCLIILLSGEDHTIAETYEWCPDPADTIEYFLTGTSLKGFSWLVPLISSGEQAAMARREALPAGAATELQFFRNIGAKGFVATPLILSGRLIGIFLVTHRRTRKWPGTDLSLFETAGDLFTQVVARKHNVDALMESEEKYRTLFDNYLNPIIIAGDDGRLTDANIAAIDFMERRLDDLKERQVRELMPGFELDSKMIPEHRTRRTVETEYTIHGVTRNLLVQVVPLAIRNRTILYGIGQDITARKQTEQLVRDQKTFLETILRAAADGIVVCDAHGKYLYLNDAAARIGGIEPGTPAGSVSPSSFGTAYRVDRKPLQRGEWTLEKALRGISSVGEEIHLERPDGSSYDLLISAAPVRSTNNAILGAVATFRDITDRKRVELEIHEQKIFLETILAEAADPIVVCDEWGNYLYINEAAFRMAGINPGQDLHGVSPHSWGTAYDHLGMPLRRDQMALERALRGESVVGIESRIERPDGSVYHILISAAPVRSPTRRIIGAVATFRDITGRKRDEERLRETTDYLDNLLTNANAPIIVWDPGFRVTRFNRAFEHITGLTEGMVRGRDVHVIFPAADGECSPLVERATAGERWESVEIPITHEDGTERTILWNSANIISPDDRLIATIAQGQDITERKQAEQVQKDLQVKLRNLASFTQENPAPILEVRPDGSVAFANIATGLALRRQGLAEDPRYFFPADMAMILSELRKGIDAFYHREVRFGDAVYGESIYLSSAHNTVRIYAQDLAVYRRGP